MAKRKLPEIVEGTPLMVHMRLYLYSQLKPPNHPPLPVAVSERLKHRRFMSSAPLSPGRAFLANFCKTVRGGGELHPGHLLEVVSGLEKVLAGSSAGTAFNLNRGKGNKRSEQRILRDQMIGAEVEELVGFEGYEDPDDAIYLVAERHGLGDDSVRKIYMEYRNGRLNPEVLTMEYVDRPAKD